MRSLGVQAQHEQQDTHRSTRLFSEAQGAADELSLT